MVMMFSLAEMRDARCQPVAVLGGDGEAGGSEEGGECFGAEEAEAAAVAAEWGCRRGCR
jgi:hypothetical protein